MAKLVLSFPPGSDTSFDLTDDLITVGRQPENALQIEDVSVSSQHAELVASDGGWILKDLGSTNGTRVQGENITEKKLANGDHVRFGKIECVFHSEEAGSAQPLPQESRIESKPAETSTKPSDFANASPFKSRGKKKGGAGAAVMSVGIFSVLVFLGALLTILTLKPD